MSEGGAGGKAPNKAGTQPTGRVRQKPGWNLLRGVHNPSGYVARRRVTRFKNSARDLNKETNDGSL